MRLPSLIIFHGDFCFLVIDHGQFYILSLSRLGTSILVYSFVSPFILSFALP